MVSIRLIAFAGWLLLMLNISFVFGVRPSEIDPKTRKAIREGILRCQDKVYDNQQLYFCVVWQHFREYFADENSPVLDFLDDLHLTPSHAGAPVDLATLRTSLRQWIPEYVLDQAQCPDMNDVIEHNVHFKPTLAQFMNENRPRAQYEPIANALKQDYVRYSQEPDAQAKRRLVGKTSRTSPYTVYALLARARFLKTVLRTFDLMLTRQGNQDNDLVEPEQVNPVVAEPVASAPVVAAPIAPAPVVPAAVPATIQQPQVPNPPPRVPSPRLEPQIVPNSPPRVPSPRLVPQIVPNLLPRVPSPRLGPQIVTPNPRLPHIPSALDILAGIASRLQPAAGPMRQDRRRDRLEQHDGGPPRRGHGHHHHRNGPRQN